MAGLTFGMHVSLDGFADHDIFAPDPVLFEHWIGLVAGLRGTLYGRKCYEIMRYWDEAQPGWGAAEQRFAEAWRAMPKWVASRSLSEVGPNAVLVEGDVVAFARGLKAREEGEIAVAGPELAQVMTGAGLIDAYRLYVVPVAPGQGTRFFRGPVPALRLSGAEEIGTAMRLSYVSQ